MIRLVLKRVDQALLVVAVIAIMAMMLHVTADAGSRFLFNRPLVGTIEMVETYYMIALVTLPFAYVARAVGHIHVELFTQRLKPRNLARLESAVGCVTLFYLVILGWQLTGEAVNKTAIGEIREAGVSTIPAWPVRWTFAVGVIAMALAVAVRLVDDFAVGFLGKSEPGDSGRRPGELIG